MCALLLATIAARLYRERAVTLRLLSLETDDPARRLQAQTLARRLALRLAEPGEPGETGASGAPGEAGAMAAADDLILALRDDGLEVRDATMKAGKGVRVDFLHLGWRGRGGVNLSRRQPLARAIGRDTQRVIDATAGVGQDAALLAAMGFEVLAIERHAALAAMLEEALHRAEDHPATAKLLGSRLRIVHADAREFLQRGDVEAECVYLDPMFPPKRRASALAKKEIRLVRALVGDDEDAAELLAIARRHVRRIVVKRPDRAPPLEANPVASIPGKLVRYDVYVR